jgi:hypothetical protein
VHYVLVFHRASLPGISPAVSLEWNGSIVELLQALPERIWSNGNVPEGRCVDFIGACFALPSINTSEMEVWNIDPPHTVLESDNEFEWYRKKMASIQEWEARPILVNLDPPFDVSQGGVELWRCPVTLYINICAK